MPVISAVLSCTPKTAMPKSLTGPGTVDHHAADREQRRGQRPGERPRPPRPRRAPRRRGDPGQPGPHGEIHASIVHPRPARRAAHASRCGASAQRRQRVDQRVEQDRRSARSAPGRRELRDAVGRQVPDHPARDRARPASRTTAATARGAGRGSRSCAAAGSGRRRRWRCSVSRSGRPTQHRVGEAQPPGRGRPPGSPRAPGRTAPAAPGRAPPSPTRSAASPGRCRRRRPRRRVPARLGLGPAAHADPGPVPGQRPAVGGLAAGRRRTRRRTARPAAGTTIVLPAAVGPSTTTITGTPSPSPPSPRTIRARAERAAGWGPRAARTRVTTHARCRERSDRPRRSGGPCHPPSYDQI